MGNCDLNGCWRRRRELVRQGESRSVASSSALLVEWPEIFTSGFVGIGTFMLLASFDQPTGALRRICTA